MILENIKQGFDIHILIRLQIKQQNVPHTIHQKVIVVQFQVFFHQNARFLEFHKNCFGNTTCDSFLIFEAESIHAWQTAV